jgi:hypothetical protein
MPVDPRPSGRALAIALVALLLVALLPLTGARPAGAGPPVAYRPPVDAPVVDGFRPPTTPYGPGNRGVDYGTDPGTVVRAAADGVVTFAGLVAGSRHVTVLHDDGLRTTASYLDRIDVVVGQRVRQGDELGTTAAQLHFSARDGDAYLDPLALFGSDLPHVWLVPFDQPPGPGPVGEQRAIRMLLGFGRGLLHRAGDAAGVALGEATNVAADLAAQARELAAEGAGLGGDAAEWWKAHGGELVRTVAEYAGMLVPELALAQLALTTLDGMAAAWREWRRPCTADDQPVGPPPKRRLAVLVAGLGSTDTEGAIDDLDTGALGYEAADVERFSYEGGVTPGSPGHPAGVEVHPYAKADSEQDLRLVGERLADLVEDLASAVPGVPIDLMAHSQGGLVARLAVEELRRRGEDDLVGLLATIATPHHGADLATAARAASLGPFGDPVIDAIEGRSGLDQAAAAQLSEAGDLIAHLEATPLPEHLRAVSIAARSDYVVASPQAALDGATNVIVPVAGLRPHDAVPGDPHTTRALTLALAGRAPACRGLADALLDQSVGRGISLAEDWAGGIAAAASLGVAAAP